MFYLGIGVLVLAAIWLLMFLLQDHLLFHPQRLRVADLESLRQRFPQAEEVEIATGDGHTLRGWLVPGSGPGPCPLLIYFGGNADEMSWHLDDHRHLDDFTWLMVNYRGYGRSSGYPSESAILDDALLLYDHFSGRDDIDRHCVVAMGCSLGSGVAVHLAANRSLNAVVLVTPYDSITRVAQRHHPYVPVRWLLRHPFDSLAVAGKIQTPALMLIADRDTIIPLRHSEALYAAWGGPKHWMRLGGTGHINILEHPESWPAIATFLRESCRPDAD